MPKDSENLGRNLYWSNGSFEGKLRSRVKKSQYQRFCSVVVFSKFGSSKYIDNSSLICNRLLRKSMVLLIVNNSANSTIMDSKLFVMGLLWDSYEVEWTISLTDKS